MYFRRILQFIVCNNLRYNIRILNTYISTEWVELVESEDRVLRHPGVWG